MNALYLCIYRSHTMERQFVDSFIKRCGDEGTVYTGIIV